MNHMETARCLRADESRHYNCAQAVLVTYAGEMGLTEEEAFRLGASFGSGMHLGSTGGAITAALMVLGMAGRDDLSPQLLRAARANHPSLDCPELLKLAKEKGMPRKDHCDGMVFELVQALEQLQKPEN